MYTPSTGCNKKGIFPLRKLHAYNRVKSKKGEINKQISGKKRERERERERDRERARKGLKHRIKPFNIFQVPH